MALVMMAVRSWCGDLCKECASVALPPPPPPQTTNVSSAHHKNPKARVINLEFGNKLQENIKPKYQP